MNVMCHYIYSNRNSLEFWTQRWSYTHNKGPGRRVGDQTEKNRRLTRSWPSSSTNHLRANAFRLHYRHRQLRLSQSLARSTAGRITVQKLVAALAAASPWTRKQNTVAGRAEPPLIRDRSCTHTPPLARYPSGVLICGRAQTPRRRRRGPIEISEAGTVGMVPRDGKVAVLAMSRPFFTPTMAGQTVT